MNLLNANRKYNCVLIVLLLGNLGYSLSPAYDFEIKPDASLKSNINANRELIDIVRDSFLNDHFSDPNAFFKTINKYRGFVAKYPDAKAVVTAKFICGLSAMEIHDPNGLIVAKQYFTDLAKNHVGIESRILSKYILKYYKLREARSNSERIVILEELRDSLSDLLPLLELQDKKNDEATIAIKKMITKNEDGLLSAEIELLKGCLVLELGEEENAIGIFKEISIKYPGTKWDIKAQRQLKTIEYLKSKGLNVGGRLGYSKDDI